MTRIAWMRNNEHHCFKTCSQKMKVSPFKGMEGMEDVAEDKEIKKRRKEKLAENIIVGWRRPEQERSPDFNRKSAFECSR